jgi:hypothetical protein
VILLCDEDVGTGVPRALTLVGYDARSLYGQGWAGLPDVTWLGHAAHLECLILSCNKKMLLVPGERNAIILNNVGIVFLTSGQELVAEVLRLLLTKWKALETLYNTTPRPFARFLSLNGRLSTRYRNLKL